jgi:signal transduction histidine kinase
VEDLTAVVREALSNVGRHAKAAHADLALSVSPTGLVLEVTDDGVGIAEDITPSGLANLRRRAEHYGGSLTVAPVTPSPPGTGASTIAARGTRLTWTIPLS